MRIFKIQKIGLGIFIIIFFIVYIKYFFYKEYGLQELGIMTLLPILFIIGVQIVYDDFLYEIKEIYYKYRTGRGIKKTKEKELEKKFIKLGGIFGFKKIEKNHIALVIISESKNDISILDSINIEKFLEYYSDKKKDCRLYLCNIADDFLKIVNSKYVIGLHIFGHGSMNHIVFEDGLLSYRECRHANKKEYVAQHHCNHRGKIENSIAGLLGVNIYAPKGKIYAYDINKDIIKLRDGTFWKKNKLICG